jgi:steroid 5-alpha reductase family enzyme
VTSFAVHPFLTGLALTFGVLIALFVMTWLLALRVGRFNIVDVVWGLAFVVVALTSYLWSVDHGTDTWRRALCLALVAVWGVRLAGYLAVRSAGKGEDPRYDAILGDRPGKAVRALGMIFISQALIAWFISLPVQAAMYVRSGWSWLAVAGTAVWAIGLFFETVGDAQLNAFRRDPANRGKVMDRGLWRYTRHPNYFGDATVWAGLYLIAAEHWIGALTIASPVLMAWFLSFKTGKPMLEKQLARTKPGYATYMATTSGFFPLPPRRIGGSDTTAVDQPTGIAPP